MNYLKYKENKSRGTFNFPVEFYFITQEDSRYNMHYHWHTEIEIIRILEGEFPLILNEQIVYAKKNDIIFISPEVLHGGLPKNCVYECIVIDMSMFLNNNICTNYLKEMLDKKIIINYDIHKNESIKIYLNNMFDCIKNKNIGYEFLIQGYLYVIFGIILENNLYIKNSHIDIKNKKRIEQLKKVLEFIEQEYDKPITLEDLASKTNLNPKYFIKIFSQMTGKSPIQYLNSYRIEIACNMLLSTELSITDICLNCGFNDLSYFIKTFKKEKNISPKKFRSSYVLS